MSLLHSPSIVSTNIVLALDAANIKSYPFRSAVANSAYSTWYCFVSRTATYSMTEPGSIIYENNAGTITTVVAASAIPQRGTFAITAGRTYYSNGPIFLTVEDAQHSIAPLTMAASTFIHYTNRLNPGTVYVYAPVGATTINFYDATATGISGTVTSTLSLSQGQSGTINLANLGWSYFTSTLPVIMTTTQSGADKTIIPPATQTVYNRYTTNYNTAINTTPSTVGSYVVSSTTSLVASITIADGSGGDCAQGLGLESLSTNYSWGNVLSDYVIVAPYNNTSINVSYWSGTAWITWDTHVLTGGTTLNPIYVARDGTQGPGVPATNINGSAANMANGATLWRWTGSNPFYLGLNDSVDDEVSMLGWTASNNALVLGYNNLWYDNSTTGLTGSPTNGVTYNSDNNGYFNFDYTRSQSMAFPSSSALQFLGRSAYTLEAWVYPTRNPGQNNWTGIFNRESDTGTGRDGYNLYLNGSTGASVYWVTERFTTGTYINVTGTLDQSVVVNNWQHIVGVYDGAILYLYRNGVLLNSTASTGSITNATQTLQIGRRDSNYFGGRISNTKIYNRALTAGEIIQNFNALRGRYGI
jgi:hypothetical protein